MRSIDPSLVGPSGAWLFNDPKRLADEHYFDRGLAKALCEIIPAHDSVIDFGCGLGDYLRVLPNQNKRGYDGNPFTNEITGGLCQCLDLSYIIDVEPADWVLCLEVGEHLPREHESTLLDNITRHALNRIILSWCIPEAEWPTESGVREELGLGHVNCRPNLYIRDKMHLRGWRVDTMTERYLRSRCLCSWFPYTLMVFAK